LDGEKKKAPNGHSILLDFSTTLVARIIGQLVIHYVSNLVLQQATVAIKKDRMKLIHHHATN
jgi:hypothetical protein